MNTLLSLPGWLKIVIGALLVVLVALLFDARSSGAIAQRLEERAAQVIAQEGGDGIVAEFHNKYGWPTRHPNLSGGEDLSDETRARVARAVSNMTGVGGVHWSSVRARGPAEEVEEPGPFHCERDVEALLSVRVIRFAEGSAKIQEASEVLLDEVAGALKPCGGSIISIAGHSDAVGDAAVNLRLSRERARAVRDALVERGLPRASLRAEGLGSAEPVEGLEPTDPANRRIEFSVISVAPKVPTPVDTPDAG